MKRTIGIILWLFFSLFRRTRSSVIRVFLYGSELSAVTAASALAWVGHQVEWLPHQSAPWTVLSQVAWLRSEPELMPHIQRDWPMAR